MYNHFIKSKPSKEDMSKIMKLFDPRNNKNKKIKNPSEIDKNMFKLALINYMEPIIMNHRIK